MVKRPSCGCISIHAPRVGSDHRPQHRRKQALRFQSTLPVWGATSNKLFSLAVTAYFNPRSPCGERPAHRKYRVPAYAISIHAPRVGSDRCCLSEHLQQFGFQSTLPVWGATPTFAHIGNQPVYISIHAPRVGSDRPHKVRACKTLNISIHAPRVGSDPCHRLPRTCYRISIHAPRVGSDHTNKHKRRRWWRFQSTLPVWGATGAVGRGKRVCGFQSTLPVWGATRYKYLVAVVVRISIHAPRVGSDAVACVGRIRKIFYFNPRSPCGERPCFWRISALWLYISIHAPRVGSDLGGIVQGVSGMLFQSTLPVWGATNKSIIEYFTHKFQSTLPVWGATYSLVKP